MLSWQVPYLAKGHRPDFNNGQEGYSNNGRILASEVYLNPAGIMAPPQSIPVLCQMESQLFKSPTYAFLTVAISGQGPQA